MSVVANDCPFASTFQHAEAASRQPFKFIPFACETVLLMLMLRKHAYLLRTWC
jgi:hypothetical protein